MLFGVDIHVFMDHKNLMCNTLKTQRVLRWHTKIEEFSPMLHYIKGPRNTLANNLSRLHCLVTPAQIAEGKKLVEPAEVSIEEEDEAYFLGQEYSGLNDEDVWECIECYLTFSSPLMGPYALPPHSLLQILHKNYKSTEDFNMKYTT
jgi:hypothetical protein